MDLLVQIGATLVALGLLAGLVSMVIALRLRRMSTGPVSWSGFVIAACLLVAVIGVVVAVLGLGRVP